ncbi:MAG TPA: 2Fe-2S iron-sulfur cluster-binding protein, partial [Burkholderiaceae bacterium]|nr:2Fe-2S iron-sulfur cluster-binding protein [Burkholderiaceae bacterium]
MTHITYVEASGEANTFNLPEGWSLMQGATTNGVDGIIGECGGSCACATCHCYVDEARLADLPEASEAEL